MTPTKKVRLACRRCRAKRVKCDGGIPACGNCARAGTPCVDVDGRNNAVSIPRDYAARCHARVQWLEEQIRLLDPEFDLTKGPQLDGPYVPEAPAAAIAVPQALDSGTPDQTSEAVTRKRSYTFVQDSEPSPSVGARSVHMDLGMLSLQSDSRQKHYLGSSSGLFFTKLIGADNETMSSSSPAPSSTSTFTSQRRRTTRSRPSNETCRALYSRLCKELPSPEEAIVLFGVYLQDIHIDHPFLHPTSLCNAYNALRTCVEHGYTEDINQNGWPEDINIFPYNGKCDRSGDKDITPISIFTATLHVFMVFSLSATVLTRNKHFDYSPTRFYKMAFSAAAEGLSTISVTSLQSILLFTIQGMIGPTNLNIWTLSHVAMSHCIDLGLHRELKDLTDVSSTSLVMRKLIFYTVYNLDRSIATIQGRPLGIRDETFDIRTPDLDRLPTENIVVNGPGDLHQHPPWPEDLRLSICRFKLDRYVSEIKLLFYHLPTPEGVFIWPMSNTENQTRIKEALDNWLEEVRRITLSLDIEQNGEDTVRLHCKELKLETLYHGAITLLYQPSQVFPSPSHSALMLCYRSSSERLHIYNWLNNEESLYYTWRNIHGIFSSGATIIYCFWSSREIQSAVPFAEALRNLRICSNLLSIGGQWWPSVRRGKDNFDKVVDLTIKHLSHIQNTRLLSETPRTRSQVGALRDQPIQPDALSERPAGQQIILTHDPSGSGNPANSYPSSSTDNNPGPYMPSMEGLCTDSYETNAIDSAMETFFAEYLHGDWGWDPFSATLDTSIP